MRPASIVSEETIDAFARDGAVLIRGLLADRVASLAEAVAQNMAAPSPFERSYTPADGSAMFFQDYCNWQRFAPLHDFVFSSEAGRVAAGLMRSRTARFFLDHILVKRRGTSLVTPCTEC